MKRSEMNVHQRAMFDIMDSVTSEMIGGNENALLDFSEDDEEYKSAYAYLHQGHESLVENIYDLVMSECEKGSAKSHSRFAGSDFLREIIETRLKKWGY